MDTCYICKKKSVKKILDFGKQPICNRFLKDKNSAEHTYSLALGQCENCAMVQIISFPAAAELKPPYEWISYSEPEGHLDRLAGVLVNLSGLTKDSLILGISFKDDSLLERLKKSGFSNTYRLDPGQDLMINEPSYGVELIQERITLELAGLIKKNRGRPQVIIARHILEHAHNISRFMGSLKDLAGDTGYIVIEAPDCSRAFEYFDYTTVWEEHTLYFTPWTFRNSFDLLGLKLEYFENFPYAFENSLVGIAKVNTGNSAFLPDTNALAGEKTRMQNFAQNLERERKFIQGFLSDFRKTRGNIALFGAGHLACAFINLLGLKEHFKFAADDNPQKQGLFMPGSRLPIRGSQSLLEENIKLCILSFAPEKEEKVIRKNCKFIEQGGSFASIFPGSKLSIRNYARISYAHQNV